MKTKGISVWEQHIEYIVLAIAVLVFGYFAWTTFSNQASVKNNNKVITTENVDDELIASANILSPKLDDSAPSPVEIVAPKELLSTFEKGITASLSPNARVVFPGVDLTSGFSVNQDLVAELRTYIQPTVPSPKHIRTHQWFATIDSSQVDIIPELDSLFVGPPHDATWIQVAAEFDMQGVIEQYKSMAEGAFAIPEQWYDGVIDVFDLKLERETLGPDGWAEAELIKVMPGRLTFRPSLSDKQIDTEIRDNIVDQLRGGHQGEIIRPPFYTLKGFTPDQANYPDAWEPSPEGDVVEEIEQIPDSPIARLRQEINKLTKKYEKIVRTITDLENAIFSTNQSGSTSDGGSMSAGGGAAGGRQDERIKKMYEKLKIAENERAKIALERNELLKALRNLDSSEAESIMETFDGKVWVWAHDLSVTPGEIYRYRVSIEVANPFFGRKPSLFPEQQELADPVLLSSVPSDWSEPIEARPPLQWFVLRAIPKGGSMTTATIDAGRISAEVYRFTNGSWHKDTFQVSAGQRLAAQDGGEFQTEWFVLDMLPWLDATSDNLRDHRASWVILQNMRTGATQIVSPWDQAVSSRLKDLRLQERDSKYYEDSNLM